MTAREMFQRGELRMRGDGHRGPWEPGPNRRVDHEISTLINCVIEEHRAPLVRFIRELGAEVARLERIVAEQARLLDQSQPAPHVCGVTTKAISKPEEFR